MTVDSRSMRPMGKESELLRSHGLGDKNPIETGDTFTLRDAQVELEQLSKRLALLREKFDRAFPEMPPRRKLGDLGDRRAACGKEPGSDYWLG